MLLMKACLNKAVTTKKGKLLLRFKEISIEPPKMMFSSSKEHFASWIFIPKGFQKS